jgi:acetyltransferase-like isoleucine patch superfamily enzyme
MRTIVRRFSYFWFFTAMRLTWLLPDWAPLMRLRGWLVGPCFRRCGKNFQLESTAMISNSSEMEIGDNVYLARGTWIQGGAGIVLEGDNMLGPYTVVSSINHTMLDGSYRFGPGQYKPVRLGHGAWTGAGVKIMPGVKIGRGALCAAGCVVTKDVPDYSIVGGVPARVLAFVDPATGERKPAD